MRLAINHQTIYRFTEPQARLVQMLRLSPCDSHHQTIVSWRIDVDRDARLRSGHDGFGNAVTMLFAEGPIEDIAITVIGEVLTSAGSGVMAGVEESLSPLVYLRATAFTRAGPAAAAFIEGMGHDLSGRRALGRLWTLCANLGDSFPDRVHRTDRADAEEMLTAANTSPRDLAQMFVTLARAMQIPARFVTGYALAAAAADGAPGPHGWAEAYVDGLGWVGFDPSQGQSPDETYVRVAAGLDAAGTAPIAGSRIGKGDEVLDVDLHVDRLGGGGITGTVASGTKAARTAFEGMSI